VTSAAPFHTEFRYTDRETKADYIWRKYRPILEGRKILDVGADERQLKRHLSEGTDYWGIGRGGQPDQEIDLDRESLPFPDRSFDTVLCCDVLEHLERIHGVFDELCRVARQHVIISLPNPLADLFHALCHGSYRPGRLMKFYGLPVEAPEDRHRWFFNAGEAEEFVRERAARGGMRILQMDHLWVGREGRGPRGLLRTLARRILFRGDCAVRNLYSGTLWVVLERPTDG
jgi:hypothetical protein